MDASFARVKQFLARSTKHAIEFRLVDTEHFGRLSIGFWPVENCLAFPVPFRRDVVTVIENSRVLGAEQLRVRFLGDQTNSPVAQPSARITVYRPAGASWYDDGGGTACGFHATMGVANKTLPCGTKVKLRYHGRTVTVPVIDRGPYVAGRDYDLTTAVKEKLGFPGVGTVLASR